jgi:hypothetical protein
MLEFGWRSWRAVTIEIIRCRHDDAVVVEQLPHCQPGVLGLADPDHNIDTLVDRVDQPVGEVELDRQLRMRTNEVAADRADVGPT